MYSKQQGIALFWAVALALYAACWFLPIIDSDVGYQGAGLAHIMFVSLFENPPPIVDQPVTLFATVFYAIGWMANELFVLGIVTVWKWPRFAVRSLAFSLGIMIAWQIGFAAAFPLLIGYWLWVAAGTITLWLSAERLARQKESVVLSVFKDKVTLALLLVPIVNAAAGVTLDAMN
jgi:hypothetical protein